MSTPNRLADEQSPYLLQHAHNPVDWYPWGEEAFETARSEGKPIFLSIGYSTCHWCHVMERESFEDDTVAQLMNEAFVNIKVDREERPDVDQLYMTVAQMATGHGGWPLTILMTPEGEPFYAATYIPKESRYGRPGMLDIVPQIRALWTSDRERIVDSADRLTAALRGAAAQDLRTDAVGPDLLDAALAQLGERFDPQFGGFGQAPKFPTPHHLTFLLRAAYRRTGDEAAEALEMVETTLQGMRAGGVYDQVGFGFHRYSTDRVWLVPHFEKMLYDQAGLLTAYAEAFQATRDPRYADTVREIARYVERDLTAPEGGFFSAEDADSEGEEGKFYVWTIDELREVLGEDDARAAVVAYGVEPEGNFLEEATREKTGANILHRLRPAEVAADALGLSVEALEDRLVSIRARLLAARSERVRPSLDDKVLTDWNGLMIGALATAARALGEPVYAERARRAADFMRSRLMTGDGRLLHRYRAGEAGLQANLDDYAFFAHGLIELYQTNFDPADLRDALALTDHTIARFGDPEGGFFFTPDDGEKLLVRQKEAYDGALPSGNAVAAWNLVRLARMTGRTDLEDRAVETVQAFGKVIERAASGFTFMLQTIQFLEGPAHEVVVVGDPGAADTRAMLDALHERFQPFSVVLLKRPGDDALDELAPFTAPQTPLEGRATAYVCRNFACDRPTTDVDAMLGSL